VISVAAGRFIHRSDPGSAPWTGSSPGCVATTTCGGLAKDQIAQWVLGHPGTAAWVDRGPAPVSGLPGRSAWGQDL